MWIYRISTLKCSRTPIDAGFANIVFACFYSSVLEDKRACARYRDDARAREALLRGVGLTFRDAAEMDAALTTACVPKAPVPNR